MKEKLFAAVVALSTMFISGCTEQSVNSQIQIKLWYHGAPFDCRAIHIQGQKWQLDSLAFYLSEMQLVTAERQHAASFYADEPSLQLIRFDTEDCQGQVTLRSAIGLNAAQQIQFTLAVPFELNHKNPVTQPMPLNFPDMFWTWRNGYKFLRIDMHSDEDNWAYHLGSVGCTSASPVRAPESQCVQPNRVSFELPVPESESIALVLHLDRLLTGIEPGASQRCVMHGDSEPACEVLFDNLQKGESPVFSLVAINDSPSDRELPR